MRCLEGTRSKAEDGANCLGRSGSSRSNKDGNDPPNSMGPWSAQKLHEWGVIAELYLVVRLRESSTLSILYLTEKIFESVLRRGVNA